MTNTDLENRARALRLEIASAICKTGKGGVGECMSVIEILVALYSGETIGGGVLKFDPKKPGWDEQDYLVLSKRAAVLSLYAVLAECGFFDKEELRFFGKTGSLLKQWPDGKVPGVCASVMADGVGLPVALGIALSLKMERKKNRVFAVLGREELVKGRVWEAAQTASHYKLDNLIAFVDDAEVEIDTAVPVAVKVDRIQDKFEAFGWNVVQVRDGHDFDGIFDALGRAFTSNRKPVCIWCHTVAGKGIEFAERKPGYLKASLSEGEFNSIINYQCTMCD